MILGLGHNMIVSCVVCGASITTTRTWTKYCRKHRLSADSARRRMRTASNRKTKKRNRAKAILALGGKCIRCGFADHRALQFDHIVPVKDGVGREVPSALFKRLAEGDTSGIQLLCANCHCIKTRENSDDNHKEDDLSIVLGVGENHANAKLTDEQVRDARRMYKSGVSVTSVGRAFSTSRESMSSILHYRTRKTAGG